MKNLPRDQRPSSQILQELISVRRKLIAIEGITKPFVSKLDPLLKEDKLLSECLLDIWLTN